MIEGPHDIGATKFIFIRHWPMINTRKRLKPGRPLQHTYIQTDTIPKTVFLYTRWLKICKSTKQSRNSSCDHHAFSYCIHKDVHTKRNVKEGRQQRKWRRDLLPDSFGPQTLRYVQYVATADQEAVWIAVKSSSITVRIWKLPVPWQLRDHPQKCCHCCCHQNVVLNVDCGHCYCCLLSHGNAEVYLPPLSPWGHPLASELVCHQWSADCHPGGLMTDL